MFRIRFLARALLAPLAALLLLPAPSVRSATRQAQPAGLAAEGAAFWRDAAVADVAAAYRLLRDNHPGMVPAVGDAGFRNAVEEAHAQAARRAGSVVSYDGYAATLAAFADALGDKHIWSRPTFLVGRPDWAGLLMSRRGNHWIVADEEASPPAESVLGAELISCDGRAPDDWARQSLGVYRVDWSVGAQQVQAAPWLLVDEHNPFVSRPKTCVFEKQGRRLSITLAWRGIKRDSLTPRIAVAVGAGAAGFGVRKVGEGYWIGLQSLLDPAAPVVAAVKANAAQLRRAPFVVLDLRGNSGGSSFFGEEIARALMGVDYVSSVIDADDPGCDGVWRVSDGNIRQLQFYVDVLGPTHGPEFTKIVTRLLNDAKSAQAKGQALSGPLTCARAKGAPKDRAASLLQGRLVLITDNLCFSSCLVVTNEFRKLGALHVGQTTDANTHYTEVREELLPSGLSNFSTLQAVSPSDPPRYGPFAPAIPYGGDIADTRALEQWVLKTLSAR
jgi:hypothetical protein